MALPMLLLTVTVVALSPGCLGSGFRAEMICPGTNVRLVQPPSIDGSWRFVYSLSSLDAMSQCRQVKAFLPSVTASFLECLRNFSLALDASEFGVMRTHYLWLHSYQCGQAEWESGGPSLDLHRFVVGEKVPLAKTPFLCAQYITRCPDLAPPENGYTTYTADRRFLTKALAFCRAGYRTWGNHRTNCRRNQDWSIPFPMCHKIATAALVQCPELLHPENGLVVFDNNRLVKSTARYICNHGYRLNGTESRTCQGNTSWGGSAPQCLDAQCPPLVKPKHASMSLQSSDGVYSTATFDCAPGFLLQGKRVLRCLNDRVWDEPEPHCIRYSCQVPANPQFGSVSVARDANGTMTATFSCFARYQLEGSRCISCGVNGTWLGDEPTCESNAAFGGDSSSRLANDTGVHAKRPVTVIALSVVNSLLGIIIVCILFRERKIILGQISRCLRCRKNEDVLDPTFFTNNSPSTMATSLNFTISPIYQPKSSEATKSNTNSSSQ